MNRFVAQIIIIILSKKFELASLRSVKHLIIIFSSAEKSELF